MLLFGVFFIALAAFGTADLVVPAFSDEPGVEGTEDPTVAAIAGNALLLHEYNERDDCMHWPAASTTKMQRSTHAYMRMRAVACQARKMHLP
jgi:hypothetical protein